jgi:hypothetical protein
MELHVLVERVRAHAEGLHRQGLRSLILIRPEALQVPGEPLHLLATLDGAWEYTQFHAMSQILITLLDRPVEIVLANTQDDAVGPYLDPQAVKIL